MKTQFTHIRWLLALSMLASVPIHAQEFYRRSLATPENPSIAPVSEPNYNLRLGPIDFSINFGVTAEYNDNIRLAPDSRKESDIILRPFINLDSIWRVTELNALKLSLGLSYDKYLDNSDLDTGGVLLSPNSAVSFRFYTGDFRITLSNALSYQEDTYDFAPISNEAKFKRWENQASIQVDWDLNAVIMTGGYTHYNLWTVDDDEFASQDRSVDTVYLRPTVQITPTISAGVNASASWIGFDSNEQGDGTMYQIGPFLDFELTEYTRGRVEVGYQWGDFDDGTRSVGSEVSSVYARAEITNQLTAAFSHRLAFSQSTEIGFGSAYYDLTRIEYGATWDIMNQVKLSPYAFYERYDVSGPGGDSGYRLGLGVSVGYQLTQRMSMIAAYRFLTKDGDVGDLDYTQNVFSLTIAYSF